MYTNSQALKVIRSAAVQATAATDHAAADARTLAKAMVATGRLVLAELTPEPPPRARTRRQHGRRN